METNRVLKLKRAHGRSKLTAVKLVKEIPTLNTLSITSVLNVK